jgi:hypothetical protein
MWRSAHWARRADPLALQVALWQIVLQNSIEGDREQ